MGETNKILLLCATKMYLRGYSVKYSANYVGVGCTTLYYYLSENGLLRSRKEVLQTKQFKENRRRVWLGKKHKKSTLRKQSLSAKKRWSKHTKEERRRILWKTIQASRSPKGRKLHRQSATGVVFSRQRRQRISAGVVARWKKSSASEKRNILQSLNSRKPKKSTYIEKILAGLLRKSKIPYRSQVYMSGYYADFYSQKYKTVFEANGCYWHSLPKARVRYKQRWYVLRKLGLQVICFREKQLRRVHSRRICLKRLKQFVTTKGRITWDRRRF